MASSSKRAHATSHTDPRETFLDIAGHELRTPITALKGHVQLLQRRLRKQGGREAELAELDKMIYQVERISHELDIYLSASHITRHRFTVVLAEMDLVAAIHRIVALYQAGNPGQTIRLDTEDEHITGLWDRKRIEEIMSALLVNALKFSPTGEITVRITRTGDCARVEVSDQGVGVPAAERRAIFNPYTHGSNVENAGAGLGLHIVREAVHRHHGRVGVRARSGGGSVFWFTLPLVPPPTGASAPRTASHPTARTTSD